LLLVCARKRLSVANASQASSWQTAAKREYTNGGCYGNDKDASYTAYEQKGPASPPSSTRAKIRFLIISSSTPPGKHIMLIAII